MACCPSSRIVTTARLRSKPALHRHRRLLHRSRMHLAGKLIRALPN